MSDVQLQFWKRSLTENQLEASLFLDGFQLAETQRGWVKTELQWKEIVQEWEEDYTGSAEINRLFQISRQSIFLCFPLEFVTRTSRILCLSVSIHRHIWLSSISPKLKLLSKGRFKTIGEIRQRMSIPKDSGIIVCKIPRCVKVKYNYPTLRLEHGLDTRSIFKWISISFNSEFFLLLYRLPY